MSSAPFDWRAYIKVHPAADLFPVISAAELKVLADDIKVNGLRAPIVLWQEGWRDKNGVIWLLDGRNRLDALALLGWLCPPRERRERESVKKHQQFVRDNPLALRMDYEDGDEDLYEPTLIEFQIVNSTEAPDPYALALSLNVHRRHLKPEQKRDLIAKLLKANPEKSDRAIAKEIDSSPTTVGKTRAQLSTTGQLEDGPRIGLDKKTRKVPEKKTKPAKAAAPDVSAAAQELGEILISAIDAMPGPAKPAATSTADKPGAGTAKAHRDKHEEKIGQENARNILLMNAAASAQVAEYHGPVDDKIVAACREAARAWDALAHDLANRLIQRKAEPEPATGNDIDTEASAAAAKAAHAAADDDLSIPALMDRTGGAAAS